MKYPFKSLLVEQYKEAYQKHFIDPEWILGRNRRKFFLWKKMWMCALWNGIPFKETKKIEFGFKGGKLNITRKILIALIAIFETLGDKLHYFKPQP